MKVSRVDWDLFDMFFFIILINDVFILQFNFANIVSLDDICFNDEICSDSPLIHFNELALEFYWRI